MSKYELYWCQCSDKGIISDGVVNVDIKPFEKKVVDLELGKLPKTEYYLNLELREKDDTAYCKAGHIVAEQQFVINEFDNVYDEIEEEQQLLVDDTYGSLRIISDDVVIRFERRERNQLYSIKVGNEELLQAPMARAHR